MKYLMYDCKKIKVIPTINIKCNCSNDDKNEIYIDECLKEEVEYIWKNGIKTTGCCCGHGCNLGFIQVTIDSIELMEKLGYQHYLYIDKINDGTRQDAFIPHTFIHKTTNTIEYKFETSNNRTMRDIKSN